MFRPDTSSDDDSSGTDEIDHPLVARLYGSLTPMEWVFAPHRRYLADDLSGRVLDLGAGTGGMFEPVQAAADSELEYHAIEPDETMREQAATQARELGFPVDLRDARAEALPYPDNAFDVVLASVVFCTIADPEAALEEVVRVLKPGGEFRFFEHVRADGWRETGQDIVDPLWTRLAGGCHVNRDTVELFVAHEAFDVLEIERIRFGVFPATPFVRGKLRKRR
ncbi:class I SAM-dependent methyltransferase [Halobacteria archaeon AArc-curdl1]|uniref:Class I SAM-dependent methyltransferase n=1 Tax=Natronosalvus hydrolyticus TaxID=2979988 RepID=A0AAP2ZAW3_9EURY|nr:class I SAM-dependent methyltransferase [Halobacteria archaeon AArc-curdl1]